MGMVMKTYKKVLIGVAVLGALAFIGGWDSKPHYKIDGRYTKTYTEKDGCVMFSSSVGTQKICGDYHIIPRNGAKLK